MNYDVFTIPPFDRQLKRLSKKYPSLKSDFAKLLISLGEKPEQGVHVGNDCYKIRMAISSKNKGKSGGARVISYVHLTHESVFLLAIYDKSDTDTISDQELSELLRHISKD